MKPVPRPAPGILIALAFIAANLPGLTRSPVVWADEVTLNDPAKELALHGQLVSSVFSGSSGFERGYFWQPPGQVLVQAMVYEVFGFGIWQTRAPVIVFGAATIVIVHSIAQALFASESAALWAALLLGLDPKFLQSARAGRMDAQCLFFALSGVLLYMLKDRAQGRARSFLMPALAGLSIGIAGITHPVAISWALALGVVIILFEESKIRVLAAFTAAAALPAFLWISYAISSSRLSLLTAQFLGHGGAHLAEGGVADRLVAEIVRYGRDYMLAPLLLITYLGGLCWVLVNQQYARKVQAIILTLFSTTFLLNALLMTKGVGFYFLHPVAILAVCSGVMISELIRGRHPRPARGRDRTTGWMIGAYVTLVLVNVVAAGLGGRWLSLSYQWRARDYGQVEAAIGKSIQAGSVVWGPPEIWYAVEGSGASLRLTGAPDPKLHDYVVLKLGSGTSLQGRAKKILEFGEPLPPVFGWLRRASADYVFEIWKWL